MRRTTGKGPEKDDTQTNQIASFGIGAQYGIIPEAGIRTKRKIQASREEHEKPLRSFMNAAVGYRK